MVLVGAVTAAALVLVAFGHPFGRKRQRKVHQLDVEPESAHVGAADPRERVTLRR